MMIQQTPMEQRAERQQDSRDGAPLYLPLLALLAFPAFLLTGFGSGLSAWQPVPVYIFLCVALLTIQERIAQNRSIAHRAYAVLAGVFAALFAGEVFFTVTQFNFTRAPLTCLILEGVLLVAFVADTATRHRRRTYPTTLSARFGAWVIDLLGLAVFFFSAAFLLDFLRWADPPPAIRPALQSTVCGSRSQSTLSPPPRGCAAHARWPEPRSGVERDGGGLWSAHHRRSGVALL